MRAFQCRERCVWIFNSAQLERSGSSSNSSGSAAALAAVLAVALAASLAATAAERDLSSICPHTDHKIFLQKKVVFVSLRCVLWFSSASFSTAVTVTRHLWPSTDWPAASGHTECVLQRCCVEGHQHQHGDKTARCRREKTLQRIGADPQRLEVKQAGRLSHREKAETMKEMFFPSVSKRKKDNICFQVKQIWVGIK